jgi:hypothetical protein
MDRKRMAAPSRGDLAPGREGVAIRILERANVAAFEHVRQLGRSQPRLIRPVRFIPLDRSVM